MSMTKASSSADNGKQKVRSAEVGTDILKALAELSPSTSLSRLSEHVQMPASKVHRYLQALIASGFAEQDAATNHYGLGREALRVGLAALGSIDVLKIAALPLSQLRDELNESCFIAVWGNQGATIVGWEPSAHPVSPYLQAGVVVSLTQSATGIAFAAFMPPAQTQAAIDEELRARARSGQPDNGQFAQRIAEARQHGLARAVGTAASPRHQVTVNAFSAPVYDAAGHMVMAISTTCEAERLPADWDGDVPAALLAAARDLSHRLGGVIDV